MKQYQFLLVASGSFLLASCGKFSDGTSVWGGGLGIIPWLTGIGAVACLVIAYLSSKSNSTTQHSSGGKNPNIPGGGPWTEDNTGNVPFYKLGWFYFSVALAIATIIIVIMVNADK